MAVVHKHLKMADDQGNKTTSIDNLINELTKQKSSQSSTFVTNQTSGVIPPAGPAPSSTKPVSLSEIQSQTATPKPVIPAAGQAGPVMPAPSPVPKPVASQPFVPKPVPQSAPSVPPASAAPITSSPPSPVKEYQSSIRTMSDDLSSLKTGQKPSGINIPRTVEPPKQVAPTPVLPKPPVSSPALVPQVKLGETQKTGPMAQQKGLPAGQAGPVMPPAPKKEETSQIIIPEGGKKMIGGNFLYIGIASIMVLGGAAYWYFVIKAPSAPETIITPVPSATPTPVATLEQLLSDASPVNIELSASENPLSDFNKTIKTQIVSGGVLDSLNVKIGAEETKPAFSDIMDKFLISYPAQLKTNLGEESAVLLYGQKEVFTAKGFPDTSAINVKRLIFVTEINDFVLAASISKEWELTMTDGFKEIFELDSKKAASKIFLDSAYRETDIRYINFAYPDNTIDYAIVAASNGKFYLVISGSREAMYEIVDKLK